MKKGFTLLEMIIVMGIIVVLFLITVPNIQSTLKLVNDKGCDAQLKVVDAAVLQWQLKHDAVPTNVEELINDGFLTKRQQQCSDGSVISLVDGQAMR